jgi:hypothetical protein
MSTIHPFVKSCEISIDASNKDTYENKVRIGGDWDTLIERLDFIINIPSIKSYIFSFVVQESNYKEMYSFQKLITNLNWKFDKKISIFFNHMTNWGTFSKEEYLLKDVSNPVHTEHQDFIKELNKIKDKKNVSHNFNHLFETKINLI